MTEPDPPPSPPPKAPRRDWRPAAGAGVVVVVVLVGLYAVRNIIAREALLSWLRARGVPAQADVGRLGLGGVTGRIVVGPPEHPDFSVETSEVAYGLWTGHGPGLEIRSVRLVRPVANASWKGGKLSFGALDPLIEELRKRPPRPGARQPMVVVQGGRLLLATDYGRADIGADAVLNDGKLLKLDARLAPTRLVVGDKAADLGGSRLSLSTHGDRVDLTLQARAKRISGPAGELEAAQATLTGQAPYPDLNRRRADGAISLRLEAAAGGARAGETRAKALRLTGTFDGRANGWIDTLAVAGYGEMEAAGAALDTAALHLGGGDAKFVARSLAWNRANHRLDTDGRLDLAAARLETGALRLADVKAGLVGTGGVGQGGTKLSGSGGFSTRGSVVGMGRPLKDDPAEVAAVKRALMGFTAAAPSVRVDLDGEQLRVDLPAPLRIRAPSGAAVVVAGPPGRPIFQNGQGAFGVAAEGGGMPTATATVSGFRFTPGGVAAPMQLVAHSNFDPIRGGVLKTSGILRAGAKETTFTANGCAQVTAQRLEFEQNDVLAPKGQLCPSGAPLFRYTDGSWRVRGRFADASAAVPFLQVKAAGGRGTASFGQTRGALVAEVLLQGAQLEDTTKPLRFYPVRLAGPAILREGVWQAALTAADPAGRKLGEGQLSHDVRTGVGELDLDTGALAFEEGGLQPATLSPLAQSLGGPVRGHAGFSGSVSWSREGVTSQGVLTVPSLDFTSPLGAVSGLKGEITFTSLAPLEAAPGQRLRIERIQAFAPMTHAEFDFGLAAEVVKVEGGVAEVGGGRIRLAPFNVPLTPGAAWDGAVEMENVQVSDIVQASPFGNKVKLDARLTGRIPFRVGPEGVRVSGGKVAAVAPGRLSIQREALTGVTSTGGEPVAPGQPVPAEAAPPNAFSDFAYQAMENLAFDSLTAEINSLPEGRLGVLFHIKGQNDPPKKQVLRVGLPELLNRSFLNRPQPLPSGTRVDLTLDTSLNLDQLLGDFEGYEKLRSSAPVQAGGPTTGATSAETTK